MSRKHEGEALERRSIQIRAEETEAGKFVRLTPVVFDQVTTIREWGEEYDEMIASGAVDSRTDMSDVLFCTNHLYEMIPLARSKNGSGTLKLEVTPTGLEASTVLDVEGNPEAATLFSAVSRGDITGCSFMFRVDKERWERLETSRPFRIIEHISIIHEVSAVNDPAYPQTSITARSKEETGPSPLEEARAKARAEAETEARSTLELEKAKVKNKVKS